MSINDLQPYWDRNFLSKGKKFILVAIYELRYFDIEKRFYPTRLSLSISICGSAKESGTNQEEFIIVETNYRIYAYTGTILNTGISIHGPVFFGIFVYR